MAAFEVDDLIQTRSDLIGDASFPIGVVCSFVLRFGEFGATEEKKERPLSGYRSREAGVAIRGRCSLHPFRTNIIEINKMDGGFKSSITPSCGELWNSKQSRSSF